MKLKVMIPGRVLLEIEVVKVVAEGPNGSFGILPRHIDMVTFLVPGILSYSPEKGSEGFLAVDQGILVKMDGQVSVSTRNAVIGPDLGILRQTVERQFSLIDDRERTVRTAAARLEADLVRRFSELK